MGVLEDAIREHLELKRRHGASDEELRRQEAEALGPARREAPEPSEPLQPEAAAAREEDRAVFDRELPLPPEETPDEAPSPASLTPDDVETPERALEPDEAPAPRLADEADEPEGATDELLDRVEEGPPPLEEPLAVAPPEMPPAGFPAVTDDGTPVGEDESEEDAPEMAEPDREGELLEDTPERPSEPPEDDRPSSEPPPPRDFDFD